MSTADAGREIDAAEVVADAVLAIPEVADLHGGQFGEVGTTSPDAASPVSSSTKTLVLYTFPFTIRQTFAASPNAYERWWRDWSTYR